ncbi:MAG TPA: VanZ family protein, partial [Flavisolibacter sp.]
MNRSFKKILVLLPVCLLGLVYFYDHSLWYKQVSGKRILFLVLTVLLLYGWIILEIIKRKQRNLWQVGIQSSFYVYVFMVLTLTGFFILFREVSANDWYDKLLLRIEKKDRVNFEFFKIFRIYELSNTQILGNFLMLFPMGIYLPLLYKKASSFFPVLIISILVSVFIEFLQLITSYRSADVDDVLLNSTGAGAGFLFFAVAKA